jgi:hypothetical protein
MIVSLVSRKHLKIKVKFAESRALTNPMATLMTILNLMAKQSVNICFFFSFIKDNKKYMCGGERPAMMF